MLKPQGAGALSGPRLRKLYAAIKKRAGKANRPGSAADKDRGVDGAEAERRSREEGGGRHGVVMSQLGATWNHVFQQAPADMKMNDKQKSMMDRAKASKATMGVGMMAAPRPPMVEYALTKDANAPTPAKDAAKITVTLSDRHGSHDHAHERRHQVRHVHLARHGRRHRCASDAHVVAGRQDGRHRSARGPHLFDPPHGRRDACRRRDGRGPHAAGARANAAAHARQ